MVYSYGGMSLRESVRIQKDINIFIPTSAKLGLVARVTSCSCWKTEPVAQHHNCILAYSKTGSTLMGVA